MARVFEEEGGTITLGRVSLGERSGATFANVTVDNVFYFGVPPGDTRFSYPQMPSYGVPGCTGWPALPLDHRGFRVRTGGRAPEDPDTSDRWVPPEAHERPRQILEQHFPDR